jgi:hypothetical protein
MSNFKYQILLLVSIISLISCNKTCNKKNNAQLPKAPNKIIAEFNYSNKDSILTITYVNKSNKNLFFISPFIEICEYEYVERLKKRSKDLKNTSTSYEMLYNPCIGDYGLITKHKSKEERVIFAKEDSLWKKIYGQSDSIDLDDELKNININIFFMQPKSKVEQKWKIRYKNKVEKYKCNIFQPLDNLEWSREINDTLRYKYYESLGQLKYKNYQYYLENFDIKGEVIYIK